MLWVDNRGVNMSVWFCSYLLRSPTDYEWKRDGEMWARNSGAIWWDHVHSMSGREMGERECMIPALSEKIMYFLWVEERWVNVSVQFWHYLTRSRTSYEWTRWGSVSVQFCSYLTRSHTCYEWITEANVSVQVHSYLTKSRTCCEWMRDGEAWVYHSGAIWWDHVPATVSG